MGSGGAASLKRAGPPRAIAGGPALTRKRVPPRTCPTLRNSIPSRRHRAFPNAAAVRN